MGSIFVCSYKDWVAAFSLVMVTLFAAWVLWWLRKEVFIEIRVRARSGRMYYPRTKYMRIIMNVLFGFGFICCLLAFVEIFVILHAMNCLW